INLILSVGMTNGGKSTLSKSLHQQIPNSLITVDSFFLQDDSVVPVDSNGFKQYDSKNTLFDCLFFNFRSQKCGQDSG
uniref:Uncharacterized protein n=1 Tax=Seriola lalandi dorsalis TaxID=1841481 RepID=A0A3B4WNJ0_SERLL